MPKQKNIPATPARLVADKFGGPEQLAVLMGKHRQTVWSWIYRGGRIPNTKQKDGGDTHTLLLALAKKHGVKLTEREIIQGGVR